MMSNIALVSVGLNTPSKIDEERIWTKWLKSMCGDCVYLINIISVDKQYPIYRPQDKIDHFEYFDNLGHIPGVTIGFTRGISHLRRVGFTGNVIFTNPDVVPNEEFLNLISNLDRERPQLDIYGHDWGPGCVATDFLFMTYDAWTTFIWPRYVGVSEYGHPIMQDSFGDAFIAPKYSAALEQWASLYIKRMAFNNNILEGSKNVAWPPNVGVRMDIDGIRFNIVHSGGDARPTKLHLTNKYKEFDRLHGS